MYLATDFSQCNALKLVGNDKRQCLNPAIEGLCKECENKSLIKNNNAFILQCNVGSNNYNMVTKCLETWPMNSYMLLVGCHAVGVNTNSSIIELLYFNDHYPQSLFIQGKSYQLRLSLNVLNYIYEKIFLIGCLAEQDGILDLKKSWMITKITKEHLKLLHL